MNKTTTVTIADFLLARLAEDEAAAREATSGPWGRAAIDGQGFAVHRGEHETVALYCDRDNAEHIARHDPARILRDVEAKRRVVELHKDPERVVKDPDAPEGLALAPGGPCLECHHATHPCPTLRALVSVYADHEDFDAGWAL